MKLFKENTIQKILDYKLLNPIECQDWRLEIRKDGESFLKYNKDSAYLKYSDNIFAIINESVFDESLAMISIYSKIPDVISIRNDIISFHIHCIPSIKRLQKLYKLISNLNILRDEIYINTIILSKETYRDITTKRLKNFHCSIAMPHQESKTND